MIPRHIFDSEHDVFRDMVRKFLMDEAYEQHVQWEKDGQIDRNFWYKAGEQGMLCPGASRSTAVLAQTSATTWWWLKKSVV